MKKVEIFIETLSPACAVEKLSRAQIPVLGAEKTQKNGITVWVDGKDCKKAFAIFKGSCYNVKKVRTYGAERFKELGRRFMGMLVGAALFLGGVGFLQTRVLRIEVYGSGAYYSAQVKDVLSQNGVTLFSGAPKRKNDVTSSILSLERVSFCSLRLAGGILRVRVEVSDEDALLTSVPLLAPRDGTVTRLLAVRGTPCVQVGDKVSSGATLVSNVMEEDGGGRRVVVIATATLSYPVSEKYALGREEALAQALLDHGPIEDLKISEQADGFLIEGKAAVEISLNLQ